MSFRQLFSTIIEKKRSKKNKSLIKFHVTRKYITDFPDMNDVSCITQSHHFPNTNVFFCTPYLWTCAGRVKCTKERDFGAVRGSFYTFTMKNSLCSGPFRSAYAC